MKAILTLLLTTITFVLNAQSVLVPGDAGIETKWAKNEKYEMKWFVISNNERYEVATIVTEVLLKDKDITLRTNVNVKNAKTSWLDVTTAEFPTLKPVYHSSDNLERRVELNFGAAITGSYVDKANNQQEAIINDATDKEYFDSNFYPYLVRLLPLKEEYTKDIAIYDYSPAGKGVITASIKKVASGSYKTKNGVADVWIVTSIETIKGQTSTVDYYIDKKDRKLWKQDVTIGIQKMLIERIEQ